MKKKSQWSERSIQLTTQNLVTQPALRKPEKYFFVNLITGCSPKKLFSCQLCGKVLCSKASLKRHIADKHAERQEEYRCIICERVYCSRNSLMTHIYTYHKSRPGELDMKDIKFFQDLKCENVTDRKHKHSTLTSPPARQISYQLNNYNSTATAYWSTLLSYTDNEFMRCCHLRHGVAPTFHVRQGQLNKEKY